MRFSITRDSFGIPHVTADSEEDAWFGMGYACALDRGFQLDYDRRRATGRWAEVAGPSAVEADILARRMGLTDAAARDVAAMSPRTHAAFSSYAAGVNHGVPDLEWEPWHSVAAYKIRHVLMGQWQHKLAAAVLVASSDPSVLERLVITPVPGMPVAVPPLGRVSGLVHTALADVTGHLGFLAESEPGSNAWAVGPGRSATGTAIICNDSHRALDTPNVYWQCRVTCPAFDVAGATFPGLPGFPHFGYNGQVAWAITHGDADTQDLYLERFSDGQYLTESGWEPFSSRRERILVRDADPVDIDVYTTRHGPIVHGSPSDGLAIALKCTTTYRADRGFECLRPMLTASSVSLLAAAQDGWTYPVNNLVAADTSGSIAYQCRGELPVRSSAEARRLPVPGWTGSCEWTGVVPFESLPSCVNPSDGFVMTANNAMVDGDDPYVSYTFSQPYRAERLRELLTSSTRHTISSLAAMQADTVSWPARAWGVLLGSLDFDGPAERARAMLAGWDGDLAPGSGPALLYGCFTRSLAEQLYRPVLGDKTWEWVASGTLAPTITLVRRWLANDTWSLLGGPGAGPDERGAQVLAVLPAALAAAWERAIEAGGPDPDGWRWDQVHHAVRVHPLLGLIDSTPMGGDADTVQAAGYRWTSGTPFTVSSLSVYRQVIDLGDPASASYVIPGGSSADPDSPHFGDQLVLWASHLRVPMVWLRGDEEEPRVQHAGEEGDQHGG
jgi:penicillin amidase